MKRIQRNWKKELKASIADFLSFPEWQNIIDFIDSEVDLSDDVSAGEQRVNWERSPFLKKILVHGEIEKGKHKIIVVVAPEQLGKTLIEVCICLYNLKYNRCQALIVYPTDDTSEEINQGKYLPIISRIPSLQKALDRPRAKRADRYILDGNVMYFQGVGKGIYAKSCQLVIGDECNHDNYRNSTAIEQMDKRTRSYDESLQLLVSSPQYKEDKFWETFLEGSRGHYFLQCQGCQKLTMNSNKISLLHVENEFKIYNKELERYEVKDASKIKMICPVCGYQHNEAEKDLMINNGDFIHEEPLLIETRPSFQLGCLVLKKSKFSWLNIINMQLKSGSSADNEAHKTFDNSWRGLPYEERTASKRGAETIKIHEFEAKEFKPEDVEFMLTVSDTQDEFEPTAVCAYDCRDNIWILDYQNCHDIIISEAERERLNAERIAKGEAKIVTAQDIFNKEYFGLKSYQHVIDEGGHRKSKVKVYQNLQRGVVPYKGWSISEDFKKMKESSGYLVNEKKYRKMLIYYLYSQREKGKNYLYLPAFSDKQIEEIICVQEARNSAGLITKEGRLPENWEPLKGARHDVFDVLKMCYFACDFFIQTAPENLFRLGQSRKIKENLDFRKKPVTIKFT